MYEYKKHKKNGRPLWRPLGGHCGGHWEATGRALGGHCDEVHWEALGGHWEAPRERNWTMKMRESRNPHVTAVQKFSFACSRRPHAKLNL